MSPHCSSGCSDCYSSGLHGAFAKASCRVSFVADAENRECGLPLGEMVERAPQPRRGREQLIGELRSHTKTGWH